MADHGVIFEILGTLRIRHGARTVLARGTKRDVILATLLLNANRLVPVAELIDTVWASPPRSAVANIHTYISTLRTTLPPTPSGTRLARSCHGYLLAAEPEEIDMLLFERLVCDADRLAAAGATEEAVDLFDRALRLWRGRPCSGLPPVPAWQGLLDELVERYRAARQQRARLWVEQGRPEPAIAELQGLVADDPFCEQLRGQLMIALAAAGRPADALQTYRQARTLLVTELGVEPGPVLQQAHEAVLRPEDTVTDDQHRVPASGPLPDDRMWQLPPDTADFTGRATEIRALQRWLAPAGGTTPAIASIVGPPGVGKTTLAVRAAHLLRGSFPDGQLYLELGGTVDGAGPTNSGGLANSGGSADGGGLADGGGFVHAGADPGKPLGELLRTLGVPGSALPQTVAGRAALYRSLMHGRRVLVVLDDAASMEQVAALLPAEGDSAVLVTSRRRIAELPGSHELTLDALTVTAARALLGSLIGQARLEQEPAEADRIVAACGRLPLGLRTAGARLAAYPSLPLRAFAERLQDPTGLLDELSAAGSGLRASFSRSARTLPRASAFTFQVLGLLGPVDVPAWVVDRLLDGPDAQPVLDTLVDASLLQVTGPDSTGQPRYRLPGPLRCYAREAAAEQPTAARREALRRILSGWLGLAEYAAGRLPASIFRIGQGSTPRWRPHPRVAGPVREQPLRWFDAEWTGLANAVELASTTGLDGPAWELAVALVPYLDHRAHLDDWRRTHEAALVAVRASGGLAGEAALLRGLGQVDLYRDQYRQAYRSLASARRLYRRLGDAHGEALTVAGVGTIARVLGRPGRALRCFRHALAVFTATDDRHAQAWIRAAIGVAYHVAGAHGRARTWLDRALRLAVSLNDTHRVACVLRQTAELDLAEGRTDRAVGTLRTALTLFESLEDERCGAYALAPLGRVLLASGQRGPAATSLTQAAQILGAAGDRRGAAAATRLLDAVYCHGGTDRHGGAERHGVAAKAAG